MFELEAVLAKKVDTKNGGFVPQRYEWKQFEIRRHSSRPTWVAYSEEYGHHIERATLREIRRVLAENWG